MIAIAIDGPSAAGKSTLAKRLAKELGYIYVDTGALYRAIGLHAVRQGVSPADAERVAALLPHVRLSVDYSPEGQRVLLNGEDVSQAIRSPEMGMAASAVSAHPAVRAFLLEQQRDMARHSNLVMDGRDIGTGAAAQYKFFSPPPPRPALTGYAGPSGPGKGGLRACCGTSSKGRAGYQPTIAPCARPRTP